MLQLGEVLSDLSTGLLKRLIGETVELEVRHGRDLWPVKADLNQFEQVIVNLAVNARDAMPDGGRLTIRTRNVPADEVKSFGHAEIVAADYVLVEVADTGIGIPPDIIDKIFEPFFSTKEVGKGTGLGLSTVYGIIKQSGGFIHAKSTPGGGSTFSILLPRHVPDAAEDGPGGARSAGRGGGRSHRNRHRAPGRGRGRGAGVRGARAGLARLYGAGGRQRRRCARGHRRARRRGRPHRVGRGDAGDGRADAC